MNTAAPPQAESSCPSAPQPQLRAVRTDDAAAMREYLRGLSGGARGLRFHGGVNPASERLLAHLTQADGRRHIALVAVLALDDGDVILGEARCVRGPGEAAAEFAISVADAWHGRGLARRLLRALMDAAAAAGVQAVAGEVLLRNGRMTAFMQREGFAPAASAEAGSARWLCRLQAPGHPLPGRVDPPQAGATTGAAALVV